MRFPHRCNTCGRRFSLRQQKKDYLRPPRCPHCRSANYRFDRHLADQRKLRKPCYCPNVPYPHRPASTVWCQLHPTGPTEGDYYEN